MRLKESVYYLLEQIKLFKMFGKTLWSGAEWSSGSKTIPDSDKYLAFIIVQSQNPIIAVRNGNIINGFAITSNETANTQYTRAFRATISNDTTWTIGWAKQLNHNPSGNHNAGDTHSITKVVGLVPKLGGVIHSIINAFNPERGWAV